MTGRNHHVNLGVADLGRSSDFYQQHLDFTELDWPENMVVLQDSGGMDLVLENGTPSPSGWHFGFRVDNVDEVEHARAEIEKAGLDTFAHEEINGMLTFKFRDPDGYVIEIYAYG